MHHGIRCADPLAQLVVQLVLAKRATAAQGVLRRLGDLHERVGGGEAPLHRQTLDLLAELPAQLVVVVGDQRPPVEREVLGGQRVDRSPHDMSDDEIAAVDGLVVALPRESLQPRRQGEQRGVAGEVRGRAGHCLGEAASVAARQSRAGQPKGEDLLGLHATRVIGCG